MSSIIQQPEWRKHGSTRLDGVKHEAVSSFMELHSSSRPRKGSMQLYMGSMRLHNISPGG